MKEKIYDLSFDEANLFLKLVDHDPLKKNYYRIQKRLKEYNFLATVGTRFSWLFIRDLVLLSTKTLADKMSIHSILQEIEIIEGVTNERSHTSSVGVFTGKALNGLYKKHYLSNSSDLKLIEEQLKYIKKHSKDGLYQAIETSFQLTINRLSRTKGERQKYITGEWFVFHKHEDKNYYLCLWNHDSNDEKKSQEILKYTDIEFPELRILSNKIK